MDYKISIIIPVYNVENYIRDAIDSIERQSIGLENLQVIMVNDCSTDSSGMIIDQYAEDHKNFIAIHLNERSGAAGAPRNVGIKYATGEYLMFLDPDDFYENDACNYLYNTAKLNNTDVYTGLFQYVYPSGIVEYPATLFEELKDESIVYDIKEAPNLLKLPPAIWMKIFNLKFIKENNIIFPEKLIAQDLVFSIKTFIYSKKTGFSKKVISNYRVRNDKDKSASHILNERYFDNINQIQKNVFKIFNDHNILYLFDIIIEQNLEYYLTNLIDAGFKEKELINVLKKLNWFFNLAIKNNIRPKDKNLKILMIYIGSEDYRVISNVIEIIRNHREYQYEIINGKQWLEVQYNEQKSLLLEKSKQIEELKEWISQLEKGKNWIEQQSNNLNNTIQSLIEDLNEKKGLKEQVNLLTTKLNKNEILLDKKSKEIIEIKDKLESLKSFLNWLKFAYSK